MYKMEKFVGKLREVESGERNCPPFETLILELAELVQDYAGGTNDVLSSMGDSFSSFEYKVWERMDDHRHRGYADEDHDHWGTYAEPSHSHSEYADSSHYHSDRY